MVLLAVGLAAEIDSADAKHSSKVSKPCSVRAQSQTLPVFYEGQPRSNPDGSFYPADAFYYIVWFSASPTCVGLNIGTLRTYDGLDVDYHNMTAWRFLDVKWRYVDGAIFSKKIDPIEIMRPQSHVDLGRSLQYLKTDHYYRGDDLLFSVREDQSISKYQRKQLDRIGYGKYHTEETWAWDFITDRIHHAHYQTCTPLILKDVETTYSREIITYDRGVCQVKDEYVDADSQRNFEDVIKKRCSVVKVYSGCVFGKITIDTDVTKTRCMFAELEEMRVDKSQFPDLDKCINLVQIMEQKITGLKKTCEKNSNGRTVCKSIPITRTVKIEPDILVPEMTVILEHRTLIDADGYDARNLDGTYYLWDPVTIHHTPELKWKNNRENTIRFEVEKTHTLHMENTLDCNRNSCSLTLEHPGMSVSEWNLGNGDGITIYNGTDSSYLGLNHFRYNITAYNTDVVIAQEYNVTDGLIVVYEPEYTEYPYSLLSDDMRTSYENRAAVALHYFGSVGGGPDDEYALYEDRRSKINDYAYAGVGYDPWIPVFFNDTLSWSEAQDVGILDEHKQVPYFENGTVQSENSDKIPCEAGRKGTAMLTRAGYCKVYFDYPILETVLGPDGPRYENATLFNSLISDKFAGYDKRYVLGYEYKFPESFFHTGLRVVSLGDNGTIHHIPLKVHITTNATILPEYISEKVYYDSSDPGFAGIISQDVYHTENAESGTGELDIKMRRIASKFETYQNNENQSLSNLDIVNLASLYFSNSYDARLEVPLDVGLGALSPILVNVTAGDKTRQYVYDYVDFSTDIEIILNVAQNNTLLISRYDGTTVISPPPGFGKITSLYVDDAHMNVTCGTSCTINTPSNEQVRIIAENDWGGRAYGMAPEFVPAKTPAISADGLLPLALFVLLIVPIYWLYNRIKN